MPASVLCFDDDPRWLDAICACIRRALEERDEGVARVDPVTSPREVRRLVAQRTYDLLVLDVLYGDDNRPEGVTLLKALSRRLRRRARPLIVMASVADVYEKACRDLGADDFVLKPISPPRAEEYESIFPAARVRLWVELLRGRETGHLAGPVTWAACRLVLSST
jgi:CheY-like chemotaxis protein